MWSPATPFGLVTGELLYVLRGPAWVYRPLFLTQPGDQFPPLLGRDGLGVVVFCGAGQRTDRLDSGHIPAAAQRAHPRPAHRRPVRNSDVFGLGDHYQLYIGPDYAFQSQSELIAGQQLLVVGRSEDGLWLRVRLPDGTEGG